MTKRKSKNRPLRVFEAFAGIGAQNTALRHLGVDYEVVGISEWFINALEVYAEINCQDIQVKVPSYEDQLNELKKYKFSRDSVTPIKDISRLSKSEVEKLYKANKKTKNYGSIENIHADDLPDMDLLIYSFPCQDLSTGGKTKGMKKNSGTRSGLLWEIERILIELKEKNRLPEYLLLENVKTIYAKSNEEDLNQWLNFLEDIGYSNGTHLVLNANDFGVPQLRKRAFIISHLGSPVDDSSLLSPNISHQLASDFLRFDYGNPVLKAEADAAQLNRTPSREYMWSVNHRDDIKNCKTVNTITCNMDRSNTAAMFEYNGPKGHTYRLLTIREAFLLMGFTEDEYERAKSTGLSYRQLNKLIGNSIVVNVLQAIFEVIIADRNKEDEQHAHHLSSN